MYRVIVSRHAAAVEFIASAIMAEEGYKTFEVLEDKVVIRSTARANPWENDPRKAMVDNYEFEVEVIATATPDDVRGKKVYGNLPLHLAALAEKVVAIEFDGAPPRGAEYSLADMEAAGARLSVYTVIAK